MFRSLSLRSKLLLAFGIPLFFLAIGSLVAARSNFQRATELEAQSSQLREDLLLIEVANALAQEQSVGYSGSQEELDAARGATDNKFAELSELGFDEESLEQLQGQVDRDRILLGSDATAIREALLSEREQLSSPNLDFQRNLELSGQQVLSLTAGDDAYISGELSREVGALVDLSLWSNALASELGTASVYLDGSEITPEAQFRMQQASLRAENTQDIIVSGNGEQVNVTELIDRPESQPLVNYRNLIRSASVLDLQELGEEENAQRALSNNDSTVQGSGQNLINQVDRNLAEQRAAIFETQAELEADVASNQRLVLFINLGVLLITALLAFILYRAIADPITRLSLRGRLLAKQRLPEIVDDIRTGKSAEGMKKVRPMKAETNDEIGDLVSSFNDLQLTAVTLAAEQAKSRKNASNMFVNLGHRNRRILDNVLNDLDALERNEEDPDRLSKLYSVDQKITRMRRNAESLLVLAGTQTPRQRSQPAPMGDVVRAAMAEVENFERVESTIDNSFQVPGSAITDLTHLLAELIENSLRFSPPSEKVLITGEHSSGQTAIVISDKGFGMAPDKMVESNKQIVVAADSDETPSRQLGFYVVGRLSARQNSTVTLETNADDNGLRAVIDVTELVVDTQARSSDGSTTLNATADASFGNDEADGDTTDHNWRNSVSNTNDDQMPEIVPAVPRSDEVDDHRLERAETPGESDNAMTKVPLQSEAEVPAALGAANQTQPSGTAATETYERQAPPDFEEMTKPRERRKRVPGAALPQNLKETTTQKPENQPPKTNPDEVRQAYSSFQKSTQPDTKPTSQTKRPPPPPEAVTNKSQPKENYTRQAPPDFEEMTKPRERRKRVPGAALPQNLKETTTQKPEKQPPKTNPDEVRQAYSSFQKSTQPDTKPTPTNESADS